MCPRDSLDPCHLWNTASHKPGGTALNNLATKLMHCATIIPTSNWSTGIHTLCLSLSSSMRMVASVLCDTAEQVGRRGELVVRARYSALFPSKRDRKSLTYRTVGRIPFQRIRPAFPKVSCMLFGLETTPTVAHTSTGNFLTSPLDRRTIACPVSAVDSN